MATFTEVSTQISHHSITIRDGELTITGDGSTLNPDETQQLLEVLLIWRYGFEEVDDIE
jgi:hypothetical protein